jgi:hypothetical protein
MENRTPASVPDDGESTTGFWSASPTIATPSLNVGRSQTPLGMRVSSVSLYPGHNEIS